MAFAGFTNIPEQAKENVYGTGILGCQNRAYRMRYSAWKVG